MDIRDILVETRKRNIFWIARNFTIAASLSITRQKLKKNLFVEDIHLNNSNTNTLSLLSKHIHDNKIEKVTASDGKWVQYEYNLLGQNYKGQKHYHLKRAYGSNIPEQIYLYKGGKVSCKNLPEGRYLGTEYLGARVHYQTAPVGVDAAPHITHIYSYHSHKIYDEYKNLHILGGITTVQDAYLNKTNYHYNADFRLTLISKWSAENAFIHSIEQSYWGANNSNNCSHLMSRTLANGQNEVTLCRSYQYDIFGNPTIKFLWGNLTGKTPNNLFINVDGTPFPHNTEYSAKIYAYRYETPHVVLSISDGRKTIEYIYQPSTNLNTARFVKTNEKIHKREFMKYDGNGCLQSITTDNGSTCYEEDHSHITQHQITAMYNRTSAPIGLPQIIDKFYVDFDTGSKVLLSRVVDHHSPTGKTKLQEHYDSKLELKFTLEWGYDSMDNIIVEKDAIGRVVTRRYDLNRNLVFEEDPHQGSYKEFKYDFVNRLIGSFEAHPDGTVLTCLFKYDILGNKIACTDSYGNETRYVYDNQKRLIQTILPIVQDEKMCFVQPSTHIEYDLFDNPCRITEAAGGVVSQ